MKESTDGVCVRCGSPTNFAATGLGYSSTCSYKCAQKMRRGNRPDTVGIECPICKKVIKNEKALSKHLKQMHSGKMMTCGICGVKMPKLKRHITAKHPEVIWKDYYDQFHKTPDEGKCLFCGKETWSNNKVGHYTKFCSLNCSTNYANKNGRSTEANTTKMKRWESGDRWLLPSHKEYWIERGFSEEESIKKVYKSQAKFTLYKCIKENGVINGTTIYLERQTKWLNTLNEKPIEEKIRINKLRKAGFNKCKKGYSDISQILFKSIHANIGYSNVYYATNGSELNNEFTLTCKGFGKHGFMMLDFYVEETNTLIEYDGEYFHNKTKNRDYKRDIAVLDYYPNMRILRIKEKSYKDNKERIINECVAFVNGNAVGIQDKDGNNIWHL